MGKPTLRGALEGAGSRSSVRAVSRVRDVWALSLKMFVAGRSSLARKREAKPESESAFIRAPFPKQPSQPRCKAQPQKKRAKRSGGATATVFSWVGPARKSLKAKSLKAESQRAESLKAESLKPKEASAATANVFIFGPARRVCVAGPPIMEKELYPEPESSTTDTEPEGSTAATGTATATGTAMVADTASPFRFLQTGIAVLDEQLRAHHVPRGGLVHLDFERSGPRPDDSLPASLLLGLCSAALRQRGERVAVLDVPMPWGHACERLAQLRAGRALAPDFEARLDEFALRPFLNRQDPGDPAAALRFLVATSPLEFQRQLNSLLGSGSPIPDVVLFRNLEYLFDDIAFYPVSVPDGESEVQHVREANARLLGWLDIYQRRCEQTGTALYLSRNTRSYDETDASLFSHGLRSLLHRHCPITLYTELAPLQHTRYSYEEDTCACSCACSCTCSEVVGAGSYRESGTKGYCRVPITLYERDTLLASISAPMLEGRRGDAGKAIGFGPFLRGDIDPELTPALWRGLA